MAAIKISFLFFIFLIYMQEDKTNIFSLKDFEEFSNYY